MLFAICALVGGFCQPGSPAISEGVIMAAKARCGSLSTSA